MSRLDYPFTPLPRIAVFSLNVPASRNVRCFAAGAWEELERFKPQAVAGSFADLVLIGQLYRRGYLRLPFLNAPILVFSQVRCGPLSDIQHDHLWRLFGLPLLEQIRDEGGALLAEECEARDGFHILPGIGRRLPAMALPGPCPCGRPDVRYELKAAAS